jgi:hypothetical protein
MEERPGRQMLVGWQRDMLERHHTAYIGEDIEW